MASSNKRPLDDDESSSNDTKKTKTIQDEPTTLCNLNKTPTNIVNLCDDVIMHIFSFLNHDNLAKMSHVCSTLSRVSKDWTLWKNVQFDMFDRSMEETYLHYLRGTSTHISIKGKEVPDYNTSVSHKFIIQLEIKCPELTHFSLCNQIFDAGEISVKILHRKLKSLKIEHTVIENIPDSSSYLCGLNITCPDLEDIRMTFNDWFMPHCLYALAKLDKLTYLSLQGCNQFKDCIPYASITAITGFKSLQTLDLRLTPISDHELVCFQRLKNLKTVLLESPTYIDHDCDATITDLGVSGFCHNNYDFHYPYVQIIIDRSGEVNLRRINDRNDHADKCKIEHLYVRNYPKVTDAFLKNAANSCPFIKTLDITGTSCTLDEIAKYKTQKPSIQIVC